MVTVDRNTLTVKDVLPGRNQFNGTINLTGKRKKKEEDEDEDEDPIVHHVDVE